MTRATSLLFAASLAWAQNEQEFLAKGIEQFHRGEYRAALGTLEQARKLSPDDARAHVSGADTRRAGRLRPIGERTQTTVGESGGPSVSAPGRSGRGAMPARSGRPRRTAAD